MQIGSTHADKWGHWNNCKENVGQKIMQLDLLNMTRCTLILSYTVFYTIFYWSMMVWGLEQKVNVYNELKITK